MEWRRDLTAQLRTARARANAAGFRAARRTLRAASRLSTHIAQHGADLDIGARHDLLHAVDLPGPLADQRGAESGQFPQRGRRNPSCSRSAIPSLSLISVFRPGTWLMCAGSTSQVLNVGSSRLNTGFQ